MSSKFSSTLLIAASLLFGFVSVKAQDEIPPEFDPFEPEIEVECSDLDQIYVTATDNSGDEVTITYSDEEFSGGCVPNILRTYYAEDPSGNVAVEYQLIVVTDTTPPIFIGAGEDMVMSCEEDLPEIPDVIAYDECQDEEIEDLDFQTEFIDGLCEQVIIWTWSATDVCGNYGEYSKTITIIDETAPVFSEEPENMYIECDEDYPAAPDLTVTDNCSEFTVSFEEETIEGGLGSDQSSYCTAQDVSWQNDIFSLKLIESPAQENYMSSDLVFMQMPDMGEGVTAVLSGNVYGQDNPDAGWFVYMEFDHGVDWETWSDQDFPTSYRDDYGLVGENYLDWTYLLLNSSNSEMIGLGDYEGSFLQLSHNPPNNYYAFQLGVGASNHTLNHGLSGWFQATGTFYDSSSSDPEIVNGMEFDHAGDIYTDLVCCPLETVIRTWTAEDVCGNSSSVQQVITKIDVLGPEFTYVPEDIIVECSEDIEFDMAEAIDNCGDVEVTYEDEIEETECESEYSIYRTFTAIDECGLTVWATQIITVVDSEAPLFINAPDDLVIDCDSELPAPPNVQAMDGCDVEVEVNFSEEIIGDVGPEGAEQYCNATTPINTEDEWSLIFFDEIMGDVTAVTSSASFALFPDEGDGSTATIQATFQSNSNPDAGWELELVLVNGMDWEDWSNQDFPTSYKDDLDNSEDHYEDWTYFILGNGELTGWGDWAGTSILLSHAPQNHYYGFQLGVQAANVNGQYGIGGWVHYSGTMYDDDTDSVILVDGAGDLAFDLDCCPMYTVERTWDVMDCAGNTNSHTQVISFDHVDEPIVQEEVEFELAGARMDEIFKVSISPNPIKSSGQILIDAEVSALAQLNLFNMQGVLLERLWYGGLSPDYDQTIELNKGELAPGVYLIELNTLSGKVTKKLIIEE